MVIRRASSNTHPQILFDQLFHYLPDLPNSASKMYHRLVLGAIYSKDFLTSMNSQQRLKLKLLFRRNKHTLSALTTGNNLQLHKISTTTFNVLNNTKQDCVNSINATSNGISSLQCSFPYLAKRQRSFLNTEVLNTNSSLKKLNQLSFSFTAILRIVKVEIRGQKKKLHSEYGSKLTTTSQYPTRTWLSKQSSILMASVSEV